jgi:GNAT superfamily N-acetyltransferase
MHLTVEEIRVERATLDQFETAYQIVAEYYEVLSVVARETPEEFRREYFARGSGLWLARVGGNLAGSIALREIAEGQAGEIKRMYVRQAYRGRGIAQKLLGEAESFARGIGYRRIFLDSTDGMQAAVRLYERNGYERCERYNGNPQATIFMSKRLSDGASP